MSTELLRKANPDLLSTPRRSVRLSSPPFSGPVVLGLGRADSASGATVVVLDLARQRGARLQLVSVVEPRPELLDDPKSAVQVERQGLTRQAELQSFASRATASGVPCETTVDAGCAVTRLIERAAGVHASLIVVGLRERRAPAPPFVDHTALRIVRRSPLPIFAVLSVATRLPDVVVAAIDSTDANSALIRLAAAVLAPGGTLFLAHVGPDFSTALSRVDGLERQYRAAVTSALGDAARGIAPPEARVEVVVVDGPPQHAILDLAERVGAEAIAVVHDPHDLYGDGEMQLARMLLRRRSHSVLVVPSAESDPPPRRNLLVAD